MADTCPRCGATEVDSDKCPRCGVVISAWEAALAKMRRGPTPSAAAPSPAAPSPAASAAPVASAQTPASSTATPFSRPATPATHPAAPSLRGPVNGGGERRLSFRGSGGSLFGIHIVNVLLSLVTLGVFSFWGRVRVRRYLYGQTEFQSDRFAYHGTGGELLRGFLKALVIFFIPILALSLVPLIPGSGPYQRIARTASSIIVSVFVPIATIGAQRYRLSRTSWRGIRFSLRGRTRDFVSLFLTGALLTSLTLSIYYPIFRTRIRAFIVSHAYFGQRPFRFDGRGRELVGPYVLTLLLTFPTLGLCWFWYLARRQRYDWEHTRFEGARFRSTVTGGRLMGLVTTNFVLLVLTLGLAWPWTVARKARFTLENLRIDGPIDFAAILQEPQAAPATGDALSNLLGADFDLG